MKHSTHAQRSVADSHRALLVVALITIHGAATIRLLGQNTLQVATQPANMIRASSAILNGMVLPGPNSTLAWFEWGTSGRYGSRTGATNLAGGSGVVSCRQPLNGLSPDYVYHFRLVASNLTGVVYGADQQFTLGAAVMVWGNTSFGQAQIPADLTNAVAIGGGGYHCLALRNDGTIAAWGGDAYGQTDVPADLTNVAAISAGQVHNLALKADGTVRAWGAGTSLGPDWPAGGQSEVPAGLSNVVQIAAGTTHSLALKADGTVVAWGSARINNFYWTDLGQAVVPVGLSNVVAISGGDFHNLALKADGTVAVWGDSTYSQGAIPPGLAGVVGIAAGWYHNLALKADHTLSVWGYDGYSEVSGLPASLSNVVGMAGGGFYSLASQADGTVVCWGDNSAAQLNIPTSSLNSAVAVAAGYDFSLALQSGAPLAVALTIQPFGDQIQLVWSGGILQSASELMGTFTDMDGVTSPLRFTPSQAQAFYRVRVQR